MIRCFGHICSKPDEAVFLEALERYSKSAPDKALDGLKPGDAVLPAIAALFRELCRQRAADAEARGCLACNSIGELVGVDEKLGPVLLDAVAERVRVFERVLDQAVEPEELMLRDGVTGPARSFVAFLLRINLLSKSVHDEQALWATCRPFLQGFGAPAALLDALA